MRRVMTFQTDSAPITHSITVRLNRVAECAGREGGGLECGSYAVRLNENGNWVWVP